MAAEWPSRLGARRGAARPPLARLGDSVHVIWNDERDGNPACYTTPVFPRSSTNTS
jgi:hypothetical protein